WKVNSRLTASLGVRYDVEIIPIDQTGNYLFSNPSDSPVDKNNVSPRLGATFALDDNSVIRGGWGIYYQKTPYSFFTTLLSAGAYSNSFNAILCGPASNPICPSATSVDPRPAARAPPAQPVPRQRPAREPGADQSAVSGRLDAEEHRHGEFRQSRSASAVLVPDLNRVRASARRLDGVQRRLRAPEPARPVHAARS